MGLLIENGANINCQNSDGRTPLMLASHAGDEGLVDFLLDYNADKTLLDKTSNCEFKIDKANSEYIKYQT